MGNAKQVFISILLSLMLLCGCDDDEQNTPLVGEWIFSSPGPPVLAGSFNLSKSGSSFEIRAINVNGENWKGGEVKDATEETAKFISIAREADLLDATKFNRLVFINCRVAGEIMLSDSVEWKRYEGGKVLTSYFRTPSVTRKK